MSDCQRARDLWIERSGVSVQDTIFLETHLADCEVCRDAEREDRAILAAYRALDEAEPATAVRAHVLAAARRAVASPELPAPRARRVDLLVAVGGFLAVAAGVIAIAIARGSASVPRSTAPFGDPREALAHGDRLVEEGELEAAVVWFEEARVREPSWESEILHRLGSLYARLGRPGAAEERLAQLLADDPRYGRLGDVLRLRTEALLALGRRQEARTTLRRLARDFPEEALWAEERLAGIGLDDDQLEMLRSLGYTGD